MRKIEHLTRWAVTESAMICRHCRDYIPEDSRFCPKCGIRVRAPVAPQRPWFWIYVIFLFALIWATLVREDFQAQLLALRAQVIETVITPLSSNL